MKNNTTSQFLYQTLAELKKKTNNNVAGDILLYLCCKKNFNDENKVIFDPYEFADSFHYSQRYLNKKELQKLKPLNEKPDPFRTTSLLKNAIGALMSTPIQNTHILQPFFISYSQEKTKPYGKIIYEFELSPNAITQIKASCLNVSDIKTLQDLRKRNLQELYIFLKENQKNPNSIITCSYKQLTSLTRVNTTNKNNQKIETKYINRGIKYAIEYINNKTNLIITLKNKLNPNQDINMFVENTSLPPKNISVMNNKIENNICNALKYLAIQENQTENNLGKISIDNYKNRHITIPIEIITHKVTSFNDTDILKAIDTINQSAKWKDIGNNNWLLVFPFVKASYNTKEKFIELVIDNNTWKEIVHNYMNLLPDKF